MSINNRFLFLSVLVLALSLACGWSQIITSSIVGQVTDAANPNGSAAAIAGLCNDARNVVGLMPHPERACEAALGSVDGLVIFESAVAAIRSGEFGGSKGPALQAVG